MSTCRARCAWSWSRLARGRTMGRSPSIHIVGSILDHQRGDRELNLRAVERGLWRSRARALARLPLVDAKKVSHSVGEDLPGPLFVARVARCRSTEIHCAGFHRAADADEAAMSAIVVQ